MAKIRIDLDEYERLLEIRDESRREGDRTDALLNKVIDALGLREAYPDETTEREELVPNYALPHGFSQSFAGGVWPTRFVRETTYGVGRFKADVLKAADAARGEDALARLRAAVKGATS
ncbi:hypothetical protein IT072_02615 [Leifsonia sp. ZF2019]|uniref:hypothetical protein n=1 Tax=Leifsonia sp. ZF2019 TaxID=2781978 RepID=UPI001CBBB95D|nr:hypothetical protein [Leifsonia sp. ZF2019]UAJ79990.1 hypothetical protein IT072_02615 [Leifsonia sp. ZF2019]